MEEKHKYQVINTLFEKYPINSSDLLLDIGCGKGDNMAFINEAYNVTVLGIDNNAAEILEGRKKYPKNLMNIGDAELLPYPGQMFSGVLMNEVLSEINMLQDVIYQAKVMLKKNGFLCISDYYIKNPKADDIRRAAGLAEKEEQKSNQQGNCENRKMKRPSRYCIGRAFIKDKLFELLNNMGFQIDFWDGELEPAGSSRLKAGEGYFMLCGKLNAE